MDDAEKYFIGADLTREDMAKLWYLEDLLGPYLSYLLVRHNILNHCYFKNLISLSKRGIKPKNIGKFRMTPPCVS